MEIEKWITDIADRHIKKHGAVPPPWVIHNEHPCSMCWRMGDGESHCMVWNAWWNQQKYTETEKIAYFRKWPPPHCWLPFLISAIWDVDDCDDEAIRAYFKNTAELGFGTYEEYEADVDDSKWLKDD